MCFSIFIATSKPQQTGTFVPDVTKLYLEDADEEQLRALRKKFTLPYIYYVGADTDCSCGFEFHSEFFNDPEWQDCKDSPQALLNLLNTLTFDSPVEYYCCWNDDFDDTIEYTRVLNSHNISLEKNYFKLIEGDLIKFEKN